MTAMPVARRRSRRACLARLRHPAARALAISAIAFAALALAAGSAAARPAQAGAFVLAGTWTSQPGELAPDAWRFAAGIDAAPDGRVFIADRDEARLTVIRPDLSVALLQPAPGYDDGLVAPGHIAVDAANDRLYVADPGANAVAVFDLTGTRVGTWANVKAPAGVAVTADGNVVVGNGDSGEVSVYAPDGLRLATWRVVAPDAGGGLVRGVAVDGGGRIYVVDGRAQEVHILSADGRPVDRLRASVGEGNELFDIGLEAPVGGGANPVRYWVATTRAVFWQDTRGGGSVWQVSPTGGAWAVAVAPPHGIFASVPNRPGAGSRIARLPYGQNGFVIPNKMWGASLLRPGSLDGPEVVGAGADGGVYVLDRGPRVQRFEADGSVTQLDQVVNPIRVDAARDGTVFVTDGAAVIAYARAAGTWSQAWRDTVAPPGRDDSSAVGLAYSSASGEVIVLDAEQDMLRRWSSAGQRGVATVLRPAADDSTVWSDMAADAAGQAYALDRTNRQVHVVRPDGTSRIVTLPAPARLLSVAPDGSVFTLDRDGWVRRYDVAGAAAVRTAAFDATRFDIADGTSPSDLTVDARGTVFVADREADTVSRYAWDASATPAEPPPADLAECRSFPDKTAGPSQILLGETVQVRLTVRGGCGSAAVNTKRDIMLVLDVSGSMQGEKMRILREAALAFLSDVDFTTARVGIVTFTDSGKVEQALTSSATALRQAVRRIDVAPGGGTAVDEGLAEAHDHWYPRRQADRKAVFILISDGGSAVGPARTEADAAKADGVEIFSIAIPDAFRFLMQTVASGPDHYFEADSARFLFGIFERIAERVTTSTLFQRITVTDRIPANMQYVPNSAVPPATFDGATNTLRWTLADVPFLGVALRFDVVPQAPGEWPTNVAAWGDYTDGFGRAGRLDFPVPRVRVGAPTATPDISSTPSPSPTPTSTPTPTATSTATPTSTPTLTATPRPTQPPKPIYLPLLLREIPCKPGERYADAMLVLDTSNSMTGDKINGAKAAARLFVDQLRLPSDQAGVVGFNTQSTLASPLTGNAGALKAAIDGLALAAGTRIDRGLAAAVAELGSIRRKTGNTPVIVLLTDGRQDEDPLLAIDLATQARAANMAIFAIGLGADVDVPFLELIAGGRARTFLAPSPADLARIYTQVAGEVPCPAEVYWGGRR